MKQAGPETAHGDALLTVQSGEINVRAHAHGYILVGALICSPFLFFEFRLQRIALLEIHFL